MRKFHAIVALVSLMLGVATSVYSGGPAGPKGVAKKNAVEDPAFRSFFVAKDVGDAVAALDARRVTDCALLLAHGERVLLREHDHLSSKKLFELALNIAVEKADAAALKRLDKALRPGADAELVAKLDAAMLFGKQKRKADPFAAESSSAEAQVVYKSVIDEITLAKNLNDRESLEGLRKVIPTLTELTSQQRKHLITQVAETLRGVAANQEPEDNFLAQLARSSRGGKVQPKKK